MSRHQISSLPNQPFGLLLVEGGDERTLCMAVAGPQTWASLCCMVASGRDDLKNLATLARSLPGFANTRSVGVVLDIENSLLDAERIARETLAVFGHTGPINHGTVTGHPLPLGAFLLPDGKIPGSMEHLCRQAVRFANVANCVDSLVTCARIQHPNVALAAKGWLNAYLAMQPEPQRIHQAQAFEPKKGGIDAAHPALDPLRNFLRSL